MFKKWSKKAKAEKEAKAAEAKKKAEAAAVESAKAKKETVQEKVEEKIEDVKETASDVKDKVSAAAFWVGIKEWIDRHILCCISNKGEVPKLGAITDVTSKAEV